jgi:hypothetical protein
MRSISPFLLAIFLLNSFPLLSQKKEKEKETIHLSQELSSNSTPIKVRFGKLITKPNMTAGPYTIVDVTDKWQKEKYKSNFWGTKSSMEIQDDFSFIVKHEEGKSCLVEYLKKITSEEQLQARIGMFYFGENQLLSHDASISILSYLEDEEDPWLYLDAQSLDQYGNIVNKRTVSSREKVLEIRDTNSNLAGGKQRDFPAYGIEILKENQGIAALQFNGPGAMGANQYQIWLRDDLDESSKLKLTGIFMALIHHSLKNTIY